MSVFLAPRNITLTFPYYLFNIIMTVTIDYELQSSGEANPFKVISQKMMQSILMLVPPRHLFFRPLYRKTLILDLDETLIHSLLQESRIQIGASQSQMRMIEVKLDNNSSRIYHVYKRPYCDEFLKQVSQWYNLVIFTASLKQYADPIIDWLEGEGTQFTKRLYRNDCNLISYLSPRNKNYVKDISTVEPDLSKVIIVDDSLKTCTMNKDNSIRIKGWFNDHTDSELLNLIPILKGLNHVTDVRPLLSLKRGEEAYACNRALE